MAIIISALQAFKIPKRIKKEKQPRDVIIIEKNTARNEIDGTNYRYIPLMNVIPFTGFNKT